MLACSKSGKRREEVTVPASDSRTSPGAPTPTVTFATSQGEVAVEVEIVSTPAKIAQGLMYREHLPPDAGMLFLMGSERTWDFYMRNTLIPLDMIFITRGMTVAGVVENAEPRTETLRSVPVPSLYVLEVNGGWAAAHQVTSGTKVRFDNVPGAP
jgi:uncharacterized protein